MRSASISLGFTKSEGGVGDQGRIHRAILADLLQTACTGKHARVGAAISDDLKCDRSGRIIFQDHIRGTRQASHRECRTSRRRKHDVTGGV